MGTNGLERARKSSRSGFAERDALAGRFRGWDSIEDYAAPLQASTKQTFHLCHALRTAG